MKDEIKKIIEEYIKKEGLSMSKKIQAERYGGLFSFNSPAVYDERKVYSHKDAMKLVDEGFTLDGSQDIGVILLNAFLSD